MIKMEHRKFTKTILLIATMLAISFVHCNAQRVDYREIILPSRADSISFEEKLVQLAWQNYPENKIAETQAFVAKKELHLERWSFLDNARFNYNVNEGNLNPQLVNNNFFYPRYNIGFTVFLSDFTRIPFKTKIAKKKMEIAEEEIKQQKLKIRAEVLKRYNTYLLKVELYKLFTRIAESVNANYLLVSKKFEDGEVTLEEFNESESHYTTSIQNKLTAETEMKIAKIELEELIGMKLEEVEYDESEGE